MFSMSTKEFWIILEAGGKEQREGFGEHTLTQALPGMGQHYL